VGAAGAQAPDLSALTLREAVTAALQHNRDLRQAREEARRAEYRVAEAKSAAYPQVGGSWTLDKTLKPMVFVISFPDSTGALRKNRLKMGTNYTSSLGASLTQPLYVGGKVGAALQAARIYRRMSAETERAVRQNVVMGVMQAFNGVLLSRELEQIARAALAQAEKHLANVETRREAGVATDYDLLRARVNAANMRPRLIEAENNAQVSLLRLKEVMGVDPGTPIEVAGSFAVPDSAVLGRADAEAALRHRPDVEVNRLNIDLQDQATAIARGDFLPTLSAATTFAYTGNFDALKYRGDDWASFWNVGLSLSIPIFTGFRDLAKYRQAKVDQLKARTEFGRTRDAAIIEVRQGAMNLRKAFRQLESQELNVDEARQAVEFAERLYANGKATQLEVLDAQLAFESARTNMASALFEAAIADLALKKSLGLLDAGE
jgi:outer membrane protein TolC